METKFKNDKPLIIRSMNKLRNIFQVIFISFFSTACVEDIIVDYSDKQEITTAYPQKKRIFNDEFLAQGQPTSGHIYQELGFYYSKDPFSENNNGTKIIASEVSDTLFSEWIPQLEPNTHYYLRAYGIHADGTVYYGKTIRVTTSSGDPLIQNLTLSSTIYESEGVNGRNHIVKGLVTDDGGDPDGVVEYGAYFWTKESPLKKRKQAIKTFLATELPENTIFEVKLTGLQPQTEYQYQVFARNNRREQLSEISEFITQQTTLPEVQTNAMINIATTLAEASGKIIDNGNDPELEYGFYIGTNESNLSDKLISNNIGYDILDEKSFSFYKKGLAKTTTYYVCAFAKNYSGENRGNIISFTTLDSTVPKIFPYFYDYDQVKDVLFSNSVKIYSELLSDGGLDITSCGAYWSLSPDELRSKDLTKVNKTLGTIAVTNGDLIEVKITGLSQNQIVYYRTFAINSLGETVLSTIESVNTAFFVNAWEHTGSSGNNGEPNKYIAKSTTLIDNYYELPPITVMEGEKKYRYYFLDRNLGAKSTANSTTEYLNMDAIGYQYVYSWNKPSAVPSTGSLAQASYGWINNTPLKAGITSNWDWNTPSYSPAPDNYFIPTRAEWGAVIHALPLSQQNLSGVSRILKIGPTGTRNNAGGRVANEKIAVLFAADANLVTGPRPSFQARDKNTDSDYPGTPYISVGIGSVGQIVNAPSLNGGAAVRCFRKMEIIEIVD